MNRLNLMVAGLVLAILTVCTQPGEAGDNKKQAGISDPDRAVINPPPAVAATANCGAAEDRVVQELVTIMNET